MLETSGVGESAVNGIAKRSEQNILVLAEMFDDSEDWDCVMLQEVSIRPDEEFEGDRIDIM